MYISDLRMCILYIMVILVNYKLSKYTKMAAPTHLTSHTRIQYFLGRLFVQTGH